MPETNNNESTEIKSFKGIKKHHVISYPVIKSQRKETFEHTLSILNPAEDMKSNFNIFPRTTHLYKTDLSILSAISQKIIQCDKFKSSTITHKASDLGLTHTLMAVYNDGCTLSFDGLLIRVQRDITDKSFNMDEIVSLTGGAPRSEFEIVNEFIKCTREALPKAPMMGYSFSDYFTINETNWDKIGVKRTTDQEARKPQARLILTDPNYFTITALIFAERGKKYLVYIGEEDIIHQMIAHDFFIGLEIEDFINSFDINVGKINNHQTKMKNISQVLLSSDRSIWYKKKAWSELKKSFIFVNEQKDFVTKGKLLAMAYSDLLEKKWAFFNGPRQIWLSGEKQDSEEKIQHPIPQFFDLTIDSNGKIKIPDKPSEPPYSYKVQTLSNKINYLETMVNGLYLIERDFLTAYQTEFTLYAVWFSLGAVIIAVISLLLNVII